jgi:hypothetical protein
MSIHDRLTWFMPHAFLVLPIGKYLNPKPSIVFFIFLCYAHLFISSLWENVQISKGRGYKKPLLTRERALNTQWLNQWMWWQLLGQVFNQGDGARNRPIVKTWGFCTNSWPQIHGAWSANNCTQTTLEDNNWWYREWTNGYWQATPLPKDQMELSLGFIIATYKIPPLF